MSWNVALEIVVRVQNYSCDSNLSSLCNVYNIFRYNGLHLAFYCRFDSLEKGAECHTFIHISMFYNLHRHIKWFFSLAWTQIKDMKILFSKAPGFPYILILFCLGYIFISYKAYLYKIAIFYLEILVFKVMLRGFSTSEFWV